MSNILRFDPWPPVSISTLFWKSLADKKINKYKKGRIDQTIFGFFQQASKKPAQLVLCTESFTPPSEVIESISELGDNFFTLRGLLILCDTVEEFKAIDKADEALKIAVANSLYQSIDDIKYFVIFAYADVKRFRFYHQIVFPVQLLSKQEISYELIEYNKFIQKEICDISHRSSSFASDGILDFFDTGINENVPGWSLRQVLINLSQSRPGSEMIVNCHRIDSSFSFRVYFPELNELSGFTGWERSLSDPSKVAPVRLTDISSLIDPKQISRQASDLNLKLMKWRLIPDLNLDKLAETSCLLIGSGTLGCNILRLALSWGFRKITLIDSGKVSYSNPVRQSLFTFQDAVSSSPKAPIAAKRALEIDPNADIRGIELTVPMPGHQIINEEEVRRSFETLKASIESHDVIFLLTDSRESRWLPALLGHFYDKIVITVGLGFDSFVVMRHGSKLIKEQKPSCYFCHDVIGPSDSLSGRSLDQQCTVTRPGLAYTASSIAVELLVSLLQHPDENLAAIDSHSRLGRLPQQIRGNMANFENFTLSGTAFENCTCCSNSILEAFKNDEFGLVKIACNFPSKLEEISGLTAMKAATESMCSLSFSDFDDGTEIDNDGDENDF